MIEKLGSKTVILEEGKHYTIPGLLKYLNKNFARRIVKENKFAFTINDVHQYINKGKLPAYIGDIELIRYDNVPIDLTYIEVIHNDRY